MANTNKRSLTLFCYTLGWLSAAVVLGQPPNPTFDTVFPAGGQVGSTFDVTITGGNLDSIESLHMEIPGAGCQILETDPKQFRLSIPSETPVGAYDIRIVGKNGISSPRTFLVGNLIEKLEAEANDSFDDAQSIDLNLNVNGRIDKNGDQDYFEFVAQRGQSIVIECFAERIDSRLRAVLELFDEKQQLIASNRGYFGIDPLIAFRVPSDGKYIVKIYDLVFSGSATHYYRLTLDTGPRVAFTIPSVVQLGKTSQVSFYGWNLDLANESNEHVLQTPEPIFERFDVEISEQLARSTWPLPHLLKSTQAVFEGFAHHFPATHIPTLIGVTDIPVLIDREDNHDPQHAQPISVPCEVSGQLVSGDEIDWFSMSAKRGEVIYIEALGERIQSPCDLDITIFDGAGERQLAQFSDEIVNTSAQRFPMSHLDPSGRWVVPKNGQYLIVVRNLVGGLAFNPRCIYRLSVRREEPTFDLVALPAGGESAAVNIPHGGRAVLDVFALRRRGGDESIRVHAQNLPPGLECPEVWLGPGEDHTTLVVSAKQNIDAINGNLNLVGESKSVNKRPVRGGTIVRGGTPTGWSRLTERVVFATAGEAHFRATANGNQLRDHHLYGSLQVRHSPGGVLDVLVNVERDDSRYRGDVKLTGVGLPRQIKNQTTIIPASKDQDYISFYLPTTLEVGDYSLVIQAETSVSIPGKEEPEAVVVHTNPVHFSVHPPAFHIDIDDEAPRTIKRGEVVQVNYTAHRMNGFIGKIHCELAMPGKVTEVVGLRGRGVTFVGQTESGVIQIIANDDSPLGQQPFLRIYGVGIIEDEVIFHASCLLNLKIVK